MMFHRHHWQEQGRYYVPSPSRALKFDSISHEEAARITFGFTVVELRCETCGDLRTRELPGRAPLSASEVLHGC